MAIALCIGLFAPVVSFLLLLASSEVITRRLAALLGVGSVLISFCCFVFLAASLANTFSYSLYSWVPVKGIDADFLLTVDHLSLLMALIITGVGFLIHLYAIGYMDHDESFARFFACMNLFVFAMLLLVLSGHLLLLFVGWEGVGLASYLLIGFWYKRKKAAAAATKAFVMNRIGDVGLFVGLLLTFTLFGTGDIAEVSRLATQNFSGGATLISLVTLLYFIGSIGKSAQLPLETWLPDAMEGPTPVSALIHAATMVTAGVYLVVRMHTLFLLAPDTLYLVGVVGGVTSLFAALSALGQTDLKRVLAFSTVSQLGLMFLACGIGAFYAAMFHLTMHAFVKALLFLAAGNVIHMLHGKTEMAEMGGLKQIFTKTNVLFFVGVLAMSGIPPFATFFSKDMILEAEHLAGFDVLFTVGLVTSILTAFYLMRAYSLTFAGKLPTDLQGVKEAPKIMWVPAAVLALLSIFGGLLGFSFMKRPLLETFLQEIGITKAEEEFSHTLLTAPETWLAFIGALLAIASAAYFYTKRRGSLGSTWAPLTNSFYLDRIYDLLFVKPLETLSRFIGFRVEPKLFDGSITLPALAADAAAGQLQRVQSGEIRSYVAWMVLGVLFLLLGFL